MLLLSFLQTNSTYIVFELWHYFLHEMSFSDTISACPYVYFRYDNQVRHIRVEKNAEGLFYLADTKFFSSLPVSILAGSGLVACHIDHPKNLLIKLRTPFKPPPPPQMRLLNVLV